MTNDQLVRDYLAAGGITAPEKVVGHLSAWDFSRPIYVREFEPGERLVQHISKPRSGSPDLNTGQYFGLPGGQTMAELGIGSGISGRVVNEFVVVRQFSALEGTAAAVTPEAEKTSGLSLRGSGGATQIFIPDRGLSCLRPVHSLEIVPERLTGFHAGPQNEEVERLRHSEPSQDKAELPRTNTLMNIEQQNRPQQGNEKQTVDPHSAEKGPESLAEIKLPEIERGTRQEQSPERNTPVEKRADHSHEQANERLAMNSDGEEKKPVSLAEITGPEINREALQAELSQSTTNIEPDRGHEPACENALANSEDEKKNAETLADIQGPEIDREGIQQELDNSYEQGR